MCDRNGNGCVERREFCNFVKSLNIAVGVQIKETVQNAVIDEVLRKSGIFSDSSIITYNDFAAIFNNINENGRPVGVHMRGAKLQINLHE